MTNKTKEGNEMSKTNAAKKSPVTETSAVPLDEKGRMKEVRMSMEELEKLGKSKSAMMRALHGMNYSPSAIAKALGVRYQFVNNVINRPLKTVVKEPETSTTETK